MLFPCSTRAGGLLCAPKLRLCLFEVRCFLFFFFPLFLYSSLHPTAYSTMSQHEEFDNKLQISQSSSDDGASTLHDNPISPAALYYSKSKNAMTTGFNHPQGVFLHPKRRSNLLSERPSSSCLVSPAKGKN